MAPLHTSPLSHPFPTNTPSSDIPSTFTELERFPSKPFTDQQRFPEEGPLLLRGMATEFPRANEGLSQLFILQAQDKTLASLESYREEILRNIKNNPLIRRSMNFYLES